MTMASSKNLIFMMIILIAGILNNNPTISCHVVELKEEESEKKLLFVFGDSLFDAGNNQFIPGSIEWPSNKFPYGITINESTGRFSDGYIVPDFIAMYANLTLLPPSWNSSANFSDGANFASGGAAVGNISEISINLPEQVQNFTDMREKMVGKVGEEETEKILKRSVYLFSIGGNDYMTFNDAYPNATEAERTQIVDTVIAALMGFLKELYDMGLRKVAFQNVGPLGCLPMLKSKQRPKLPCECLENLQTLAAEHNEALAINLANLANLFVDFKYTILDFYTALGDRIRNPSDHGFIIGDTSCCGRGFLNADDCGSESDGHPEYNLCCNPKDFVLFDGGHNTQMTNLQLSLALWNNTSNDTSNVMIGPFTMEQLFELP